MKQHLIKRLHQIIIEIAKADDKGLDKIGQELCEIEKKLLDWLPDHKRMTGGN